jgi:AcrR family transcriptional regulator
MSEITHDSWIEAGLAAIARHGVEGVRVEVLAKDLGVTKGGFYRRFRDRAALLDGILQNWSAGRIAAIEQQTSLGGATSRDRLRALIRLYSERMNTAGMAIGSMPRGSRMWGSFIARPAFQPNRRMRKRSCFIASSSAKAFCFPNAGNASAHS